jgi:hypothetical protein
MKMKFTVIFIACALGGWAIAGLFFGEPSAGGEEVKSAAARILSPKDAPKEDAPDWIRNPKNSDDSFAAKSDLLLRLDSASVSELRRWLATLDEKDGVLKSKIVSRWAELDPDGAMMAIKSGELDSKYRSSVLSAWAKVDLEAALDEATISTGYSEFYGIVRGAGDDQIEKLYDLLIEKGVDKTDPSKFEYIFSKLAKIDPLKAANLAVAFASGSSRRSGGLENVLGVWLESDDAGALAWMDSLEGKAKSGAFEQISKKWLEIDPVKALQEIGDWIDFSKLSDYGSSISTGKMSDEKYQKLLDWVDGENLSSSEQKSHLVEQMIMGLRYGDSPGRMEGLLSRIGDGERSDQLERAVSGAIGNWVTQDEEEVTRFINSLEDDKMRDSAIQGILEKWSRSDPLRAIDFMNGLGEEVPKFSGSNLVSGLLREDLAIEEAMEKIPAAQREDTLVNFGMTVAETSPVETIAYLESQAESKKREQGLAFASGRWGQTDPLAASEWVSGLEVGNTREWAAANVLGGWAATDFDAAVEWAQGLDDKSQSRALAKAVEIAAGSDPVRSVEIAVDMKDEEMRGQSLNSSLTALARLDPDKAGEMLGGVTLKEEARTQIEKAIMESRALKAYLEKQR